MIVLGIDPGLSGGMAIVAGERGSVPRLLAVEDIPTHGENAKRRVDAIAVMQFIRGNMPDYGVIERAQAMPDQGSSSGFIYGRAVGALETCIEGLLIPNRVVEASAWKKANGLIKADKEQSRQRAIKLFPGNHNFFARKKDHNRAEAALIAWYGLQLMMTEIRSKYLPAMGVAGTTA